MANNVESNAELDSFLSRSFLDLEKIDENLFRSRTLWKHKTARGIYGGQIIGQALVASSLGIPENQHIHSLHSYFLEGGKEDIPILYSVDKLREGRTYCTRSVKAVQSGTVVFTMQASFKKEEPFATSHQTQMPQVPYPDELETVPEALERFLKHEEMSKASYLHGKQWYDAFPATVKMIDPEKLLFKKAYYPKKTMWIKAKGHIAGDAHQNTHKCCLAYLSDAYVINTAMLPLAPVKNRVSIFLISLDHCMWFHAPCRADEWLLYQHEAEHIGDGRAMCRGSIWDMNGTLVTTFAQEGVLRHKEVPAKL